MKLSDLRPMPGSTKKPKNKKKSMKDSYFLSIEEIEKINKSYVLPFGDDPVNAFVKHITDPEVFLKVHGNRKYNLVKKEKVDLDESLSKYRMDQGSHGESYEPDKQAMYKGVCKELVKIMLPKDGSISFGEPFRVEDLVDIIIATTPYRPKGRTLLKRFSDLRLCSKRYSIQYFKGKITRDKRVIKDNFFVMLDNGMGFSGLVTKQDIEECFPNYKWLDYFQS